MVDMLRDLKFCEQTFTAFDIDTATSQVVILHPGKPKAGQGSYAGGVGFRLPI